MESLTNSAFYKGEHRQTMPPYAFSIDLCNNLEALSFVWAMANELPLIIKK